MAYQRPFSSARNAFVWRTSGTWTAPAVTCRATAALGHTPFRRRYQFRECRGQIMGVKAASVWCHESVWLDGDGGDMHTIAGAHLHKGYFVNHACPDPAPLALWWRDLRRWWTKGSASIGGFSASKCRRGDSQQRHNPEVRSLVYCLRTEICQKAAPLFLVPKILMGKPWP